MNADVPINQSQRQRIDHLCDHYEAAWRSGQRLSIEDVLRDATEADRLDAAWELIAIEVELRAKAGETPSIDAYAVRFPEWRDRLPELFRPENVKSPPIGGEAPQQPDQTIVETPCSATKQPPTIGRYQVVGKLGEGGFGTVFEANDPQLHRRVAIKVPRPDKHWKPAQLEEYRREAQVLAKFEHENIVRVFDIGQTAEFPVYIVSQFIDGIPLSKLVRGFQVEKKYGYLAKVIQVIAGALQYAHERGVVHRDLKPANVMLRNGDFQIFLMDFGLALRDEDSAAGQVCGTPGYASPEQVSGEGHRIDGRADLFSLGAMLHEMLTGRVPFPTKPEHQNDGRAAWTSYRDRVRHSDVKPPRQLDANIPRELERICLKLLERRASDRYSCAADLIDDLTAYISGVPATADERSDAESVQSVAAAVGVNVTSPTPRRAVTAGASTTPGARAALATPAQLVMPTPPLSDEPVLKIVPKGLRSFDKEDQDFFLDLLPGARDRDGLPQSIRFWKMRIEATDAENTFAVGVLYGPSGCGKSSLMKAGLLPRLSDRVLTVYLEATGTGTEAAIQSRVAKLCDLSAESAQTLESALRAVRQGSGVPSRGKVLIVVDQFEQWLHANRERAWTQLAFALRQCDGEHVQCLLLVRDDFWLAISRFLQELEVRLVEGDNCAMADLFDPPHAKRVLGAFGVAYQALPAHAKDWSAEQRDFIEQSVAGLATENKIISVRLALFAEMVKAKPWTPATLKAIGGVTGVGVTFLEETFSASTAKIAYRTHELSVRGVLKALLPDAGTDIKGHQVSRDALLSSSGYAQRPRDFESLLHVLDRDLRLITPVDVAEEGSRVLNSVLAPRTTADTVPAPIVDSRSASTAIPKQNSEHVTPRSYQLAHDYLVPSIREWLTKKQRETWRGRAALRLEDRSAQWHRTREQRHLPSLFEYASIVCGVPRRKRTVEQRRMMRAATRHHAVRWGSLLVLLIATVFGIERHLAERQRLADDKTATTRINVLANATADGVPYSMEALESLREIAVPKLQQLMTDTNAKPAQRAHAAYTLAKFGSDALAPALGEKSGVSGPSSDDIVAAILDFVPTADGAEAKNMVLALRQISDSRPRAEIVQRITQRVAALPIASSADVPPDVLPTRLRYAALALYLGEPSVLSPLVQLGPDPTERTALTLRLKDWVPDDLTDVRELLKSTDDEALRSVVCAALGRFPKPAGAENDPLVAVLKDLFVTAPDGGTHGAIDWTLRQWGVPLPEVISVPPPPLRGRFPRSAATNSNAADDSNPLAAERGNHPDKQGGGVEVGACRWSVNSVGMTFVEIPAGSYAIGDEPTPEQQAPQTFEPVSVKSQYEPQLSALEAALKARPDDAQALLARGVAHFHLGHDELAITDLSKIIEKEPTNVIAYQFRAVANARRKHAEAAREDLKQFESLVKDDTSQKAYLRVLVATILGDGQAELAALEQQLTEHAADPNWLYDGACVFAILGVHATDDAVALKHWDRAVKLLQSAVQHGHTNFGHTASDPDLESLHGRTDFRALLQPKATKPAGRPRVELTRTVSLSNREVTVAQFLAFVNDPDTPAAQKPSKWEGHAKEYSPSDDCPVQQVNWFDAVLYCNWMSRKEGLTPCYQTTGKKLKLKNYDNTEYEAEDWQLQIDANGYRLPTEAEWEAACRARTTTAWSCGQDEVDLRDFAVFVSNSRSRTWPVGTKLPNGFGLFDAHGNVSEWCHDWYAEAISGGSDPRGPATGRYRVLRGAAFLVQPAVVRSSGRYYNQPTYRYSNFGFRVARTNH